MSALPRNLYRDPLDALLRAEAETCKGCVHRVMSSELRDYDLMPLVGCRKPIKRGRFFVADQRCDEYEDPNT